MSLQLEQSNSANLEWLGKLLQMSISRVNELVRNTFNQIGALISDLFSDDGETFNEIMNQFREWYSQCVFGNFTLKDAFLLINTVLVLCLLTFYFYKKYLRFYSDRKAVFNCSMCAYFLIWYFILAKLLSSKGFQFLKNISMRNWKITVGVGFGSAIAGALVSLLLFSIFLLSLSFWYFIYPIFAVITSYFLFIHRYNGGKITNIRILSFFICLVLLITVVCFFYDYLNKWFSNLKSTLKKVTFYLPFIILFIFFTISIEYLQIKALKSLFFPNDKTLTISFVLSEVLFKFSSDTFRSFLFIFMVSWTMRIFRNLNCLFVSSLISNKLINGKMKLKEALKLCFYKFGHICYASLFHGILSPMKSALQFLLPAQEIFEASYLTWIIEKISKLLISIIDGLELFFGTYNQSYFVILAYHNSLASNTNESQSNDISTDFSLKTVEYTDSSMLVFSAHSSLSLLLKLQPYNTLLPILSRINIDSFLKPNTKAFLFPVYMFLNMIAEFIIIVSTCISLFGYHEFIQNQTRKTENLETEEKNVEIVKNLTNTCNKNTQNSCIILDMDEDGLFS